MSKFDMQEPSVLDYVRSKLKFWRSEKLELPPDDDNLTEPESEPVPGRGRVPWRSLLAVVLALIGQRTFEPPSQNWMVGIGFYLMSAAFLIWAILRSEWKLAPIRSAEVSLDPQSVRLTALIPAGFFALAAFALFGGNLFNALNLTLWILAIVFLFWAFWLRESNGGGFWTRLKNFLVQEPWQFRISRWDALVIVAIILVVFFRIYQINGVPAEPFSDHAEKILDVYDVSMGQYHIFFPRNTGREGLQMYLTVAVAALFGTGLSFLSLKIGTVLCGLATLPYMYLLGKEIGNRKVGLIALLITGITYWPNIISRVGLRFPLYPLFVAPVLYYLVRGLQRSRRNDFILAGFFLGLGLHGYSPYRIMPILVVFAIFLYLLHRQSAGNRKQIWGWLGLIVITSLFVFLPLLRYWLQNPDIFAYRAFSRLGSVEQALPGEWWQILLSNTWNALKMLNWSDGEIWVHSIPYRPALDLVSAGFFILGLILLLIRYLRERNWLDLFLILSIPFLMLPSILSLAFPSENPAMNRAAGAFIPVFLVIALAVEGLLEGIQSVMTRNSGKYLAWGVAGILLIISASQNYALVFDQYAWQFRLNSWNSSEMGQVIKQFEQTYGSADNTWIIPYPYWVDTRLPGVWAGIPNRDFAVWPEQLQETIPVQGVKLFIYNVDDTKNAELLKAYYPYGANSRFVSKTPNHDFMIFFVPGGQP
ncbi:MAG: glycosyltransferase family 39 protein [Chloroflexota bacterium]